MSQNRRSMLWFTIGAFVVMGMTTGGAATAAERGPETAASGERPNILFILADDLGMDAVEAYGSQSQHTPNINRLARQGMRFTRCFSNPVCALSRGELMTGRYPFHNGLPTNIYNFRKQDAFIDPDEQPTFPRQLQRVGYTTAVAGKWQLSFLHQRDTPPALGFDQYMLWQIFTEQGEKTRRYHQPHFRTNGQVIADRISGRYGPDVLTDFLIDFMENNREGPFLAYYTALLPHWPWVPTPHSDKPTMPDLSESRYGNPRFHPDMVRYLDHNVGRLLQTLERLGIAENTIVVFSGDNGTDQHLSGRWRNHWRGFKVHGGKGTLTDRGTRVPLIVRWPEAIEPGRTTARMVEFADFLPTFVDLAGASMPEQSVDGRSFAPLLRDDSRKPKRWVHWQLDRGKRGLRSRRWLITSKQGLQAVHPYPFDATPIDLKTLKPKTRRRVRQLKERFEQQDE